MALCRCRSIRSQEAPRVGIHIISFLPSTLVLIQSPLPCCCYLHWGIQMIRPEPDPDAATLLDLGPELLALLAPRAGEKALLRLTCHCLRDAMLRTATSMTVVRGRGGGTSVGGPQQDAWAGPSVGQPDSGSSRAGIVAPLSAAALPLLTKCRALRSVIASGDALRELPLLDLAPLAVLSGLLHLDCSHTCVADLAPLSSLLHLQLLNCSDTRVSSLTPLSALVTLQRLYCGATQVADLAPLAGLKVLQQLDCSLTLVSDLRPLSGLINLQRLDCAQTRAADLAPLSALTSLLQLDCSDALVTDLAPLSALMRLQHLSCGGTLIPVLAPLAALMGLQRIHCRGATGRECGHAFSTGGTGTRDHPIGPVHAADPDIYM